MKKPDKDDILYLCEQDVKQICTDLDSVSIIYEVFKLHGSGQTHLPDEAYLGWKNPIHWLQPDSILVNVSLDDALPDVVFEASAVIVDDWKLVKNDPRRLIGRMYREGKIIGPDESGETVPGKRRKIDAELGEIIHGVKTGRKNPQDIILVNPFGLAIEDVALAGHIYHATRNMERDVYLPRQSFMRKDLYAGTTAINTYPLI